MQTGLGGNEQDGATSLREGLFLGWPARWGMVSERAVGSLALHTALMI